MVCLIVVHKNQTDQSHSEHMVIGNLWLAEGQKVCHI